MLLKRSFGATVTELLQAAEYILAGGNERVILCERGIRTFETYTRNTLDVSAIPAIKQMSHLPVIVDPSHAAGMYWMVEPLAMAAIAAGADGLMIEVHNDPPHAKCDGQPGHAGCGGYCRPEGAVPPTGAGRSQPCRREAGAGGSAGAGGGSCRGGRTDDRGP